VIAKIAGHSASRRSAAATVVCSVAVSFAAVDIVGFLVLLLGPIAHRTTVGADNLTGKEKPDAVNATRHRSSLQPLAAPLSSPAWDSRRAPTTYPGEVSGLTATPRP
jgi:hypothetical protein